MAKMDADSDGGIDLEEWLQSIASCEGLAAALEDSVNDAGAVAAFRSLEQQLGACRHIMPSQGSSFARL
jgi:hypothetical protein